MARTMKRKSHTNKKFGKQNGKRGSKKVYKKKNSKGLRKNTKKRMHRRRRGSKKMRGGADNIPPFDADEDAIPPVENHNMDLDEDEEAPDFGDEEEQEQQDLNDSGSLHPSDLQGITRESGETTRDTGLSVSNPDLSMSSFSMGEPEGEEEQQEGGKRRKGKKTQKRRGKKGGELPDDYNPNNRSPDLDHD